MTEQQKHFPEFYVTAEQPCPYLPGRSERKLFTHLTPDKPIHLIDNLLRGGFRRSQSIAYMPYCEGCRACISVRILVNDFKPTRNMRRINNANRDLRAATSEPHPSPEQYALFRRYIDARHADGGMADMSVLDYSTMIEETVIDSVMTEYRVKSDRPLDLEASEGELKAAVFCDHLSDGISMVYSYYTPDEPTRSLGTYMILDHIERARKLGLPYLYLGYWIEGSPKMDYKARFAPQEHLTPQGWQRA